MRILFFVCLLLAQSVFAEDLVIFDQNGLQRIRQSIAKKSLIEITFSHSKVEEVSLLSGVGFGTSYSSARQKGATFIFQSIPAGRYTIKVTPSDARVQKVSVEEQS